MATVPSMTLADRSCREMTFRADSPAARSASVGVASRRSGVSFLAKRQDQPPVDRLN